MTRLHEINEIVFVIKILSLSWSLSCCRLVPSCCVFFNLEPLSLSFDFVFMSEIFKSLSFCLDHLFRLAILCLEQHAHTLHHLKSMLIISLDRLDIMKEDLEYQSLRKSFWNGILQPLYNPASYTLVIIAPLGRVVLLSFVNKVFAAALAILVTGASQSRQHVIWERVHDFQLGIESYQQKVNLTAPTITFPGIEEHDMFSIIYEPVHGIIYKNSKKEKRVMRHTEIHKFCDATLNRVLEGLKSYNNDVKYGYVQKDLTKDETEYLKLFEEEIEERLKHRRQMRRWEMYVNGRPLGLRRERPE
ncbi:hypothetical protein Tco_1057623 [Tanacetum coccineum]|uniref:Uncharacterized protein n=1 Tax=Tanacetum coccineum TaxID=301880 RepID=A0ABQ5H652_9ASTR